MFLILWSQHNWNLAEGNTFLTAFDIPVNPSETMKSTDSMPLFLRESKNSSHTSALSFGQIMKSIISL